MDEQQKMEVFRSAPVHTAVFKNSLPAMAAVLMTLVYNLADAFFVGQTHDALQVAAVTVAGPPFLIFMAIGTIFGVGGTSVISRAMGEGRTEYARKVCAFCMWGCVFTGLVMTVLAFLFMQPIMSVIGTSPDTIGYARTYFGIASCGGVFMMISYCYSSVIRAEGESNRAMMGMLLGNVLNIILDPIMILALGWGVAGAAIATVLGNLFAAGYYIVFFLRGKSSLSISIRDVSLKEKIPGSVCAIGIPAALVSVLMSVSSIVINSQLVKYGDMPLAGYGVGMRLFQMTTMVDMGIAQGAQPLLGYCVGAKLWPRFKKCLRFTLIFAFMLGCCLVALGYLFTRPIVMAFITEPSAVDYAVRFAHVLMSTCWFFGIFYVLMCTIQAMGEALPSLIISVSRQGLIFIPVLFILDAAFGLNGLVWTQPVVDVLSLILVLILYAHYSKKRMRED